MVWIWLVHQESMYCKTDLHSVTVDAGIDAGVDDFKKQYLEEVMGL